MKAVGKKRGVESRPAPASQAEATVAQLTSHDSLESQHTYYDICPWSHDERLLVFSSAPTDADWKPFGHDTLACRNGRINIIDLENMQIEEITGNAVYSRHGGAFCMWHPARHRVFYRESEAFSTGLDLDTGEEVRLPSRIRQLSPDGSSFATIMECPHGGRHGAAVGVMCDDGTQCQELVHREQLYDLTPNRDEFGPEDMTLGNTKWRSDSQYILIAMWVHPHPEVRRSLYIASRDGTEVRWLSYFAHHHSWTPDGECILFNDRICVGRQGATEPRMFLVDFDGTNRRVAFGEPIGSHPLMHPDGTRILDADREGIYVVRPDQNRVDRLAAFSKTFDGTHHGTHPHPVWSHDGSAILYNSAESGHSEIYYISMKN